MKTNTVVVVLVAALALGLVGGIVGSILLPQAGDVRGLERRVDALEGRVDEQVGLRIGFVAAERLFGGRRPDGTYYGVFVPQVADERRAMEERQGELIVLQQRFARDEISQTAYQEGALRLQAQMFQAQARVNASMLEKMRTSDGFIDRRAELNQIRDQLPRIETQLELMLEESRAGIVDLDGFMAQLQAVRAAVQQVEELLSQVAVEKIMDVAGRIGREQGYDLVLRKEVVIYGDSDLVRDLTSAVEPRLWDLFSAD